MPILTPTSALALWARAQTAEIGIAVKTNNPRAASNILYEARKEAGGFSNLAIVLPAEPKDEVWICHKETELGPDA